MSRIGRLLTSGLALLVLISLVNYLWALFQLSRPATQMNRGTITLGWEAFYPYQYETGEVDGGRRSGMDTELMREAFRRAGYRVNFVERDFATLLDELRTGSLMAVSMCYKSSEREEFAVFSRPYFYLRCAAFYRRDRYADLPSDPQKLLAIVEGDKLRLGRSRGYAYPEELKEMLNRPGVQSRIRLEPNDAECLAGLINGEMDLVLGDDLAGTSYVLRNGWDKEIGCRVLDLPLRSLHIMFSKRVADTEVVARLDTALDEMESSGATAAIVRAYHYPSLLALLTHDFFFDQIAVLAAAAAAISGLFMARKEGYNLLGAFLLAAAPAAGGGLLRDLVAGRHPVAVVADPSMLVTVFCLVLVGYLLFRLFPQLADRVDVDSSKSLMFLDTLGLSCFTVIGVMVALQTRCEPLWLWGPLLAACTNGGGSILRDVIRSRPIDSLKQTSLYLEISIVWGFLLSAFVIYYSGHPPHKVAHLQGALLVTMLGVGLTRFAAWRFRWRGPSY